MQLIRNIDHSNPASSPLLQKGATSFPENKAQLLTKRPKFLTFFEKEIKKLTPRRSFHDQTLPSSSSLFSSSGQKANAQKAKGHLDAGPLKFRSLEKLIPQKLAKYAKEQNALETKKSVQNYNLQGLKTEQDFSVDKSLSENVSMKDLHQFKIGKENFRHDENSHLGQILKESYGMQDAGQSKRLLEPLGEQKESKIDLLPNSGLEKNFDRAERTNHALASSQTINFEDKNGFSRPHSVVPSAEEAHNDNIRKVLDSYTKRNIVKNIKHGPKGNLIKNYQERELDSLLKSNKNQISDHSPFKSYFGKKTEAIESEVPAGQNYFASQIQNEKAFSLNADNVQVLNLSGIQSLNKQEIVNQIGAYIEQSYMTGQDHVDVSVYHDELGHFSINAKKAGDGNQINLQIVVDSEPAQAFFNDQEFELIKTLDQAGIKLSEFKIVSSGQNHIVSSEQDFLRQDNLAEKERQNFNQDSREESLQQDSERRKNLWQKFKENDR